MKYIAENLRQTAKIAADFALNLSLTTNKATVVGLYGELGSGKTSFTQSVSTVLGVTETVVSPTFVIEKIYELPKTKTDGQKNVFKHLIHIDAYRLEKSNELLSLGWPEIIKDESNLILIEWPERVTDIMPEHIRINFYHTKENQREIEIIR